MLCSSKTCCLIEKWQSCNARRPNPNVSRGLESVGGNLVRWRIEKIFLLFIFPIKSVSSAYPKYHPNSVLYNTVGKTWTWKLFFLKAPQSFLIVDKKLMMKTNLSWREKSDLKFNFTSQFHQNILQAHLFCCYRFFSCFSSLKCREPIFS